MFIKSGNKFNLVKNKGKIIGERISTNSPFEATILIEGRSFGSQSDLMVRHNGVDTAIQLSNAPFILTPHTNEPVSTHVARVSGSDSSRFIDDFHYANLDIAKLNPDVWDQTNFNDRWVQDEFQWGYTQTPKIYMPVALHMFRGGGLGGNVKALLKPNSGYFEAFDYSLHKYSSLNFGGNLEVSPSVSGHPFGRAYYGGTLGRKVNGKAIESRTMLKGFTTFFDRQGVQKPLEVPTDWLRVGHVDEVVTFIPSRTNPKGFVMLVASPKLALATIQSKMNGQSLLDVKYRRSYGWKSVADMLSHFYLGFDFERYNELVDQIIFGMDHENPSPDSIVGKMMTGLNLSPADVVELPVLFRNHGTTHFSSVAASPLVINMSVLGNTLIIPDPFWPEFNILVRDALKPHSSDIVWIDDWWTYHVAEGEVHCGTNEQRRPFARNWWK